MTGVIGTSNLPVSGMTIAALLIITLVFLGLGWTSKEENTILLLFITPPISYPILFFITFLTTYIAKSTLT